MDLRGHAAPGLDERGRTIMELWPHLEPVHHLPGRLRLRGTSRREAATLARGVALASLPGVARVQHSPVAVSLFLLTRRLSTVTSCCWPWRKPLPGTRSKESVFAKPPHEDAAPGPDFLWL